MTTYIALPTAILDQYVQSVSRLNVDLTFSEEEGVGMYASDYERLFDKLVAGQVGGFITSSELSTSTCLTSEVVIMLTDEQRRKWIVAQVHFVASEIQKRDRAFGLPLTSEEYNAMSLSDLERILNELKQLAKSPPPR